MPEFEAQGGSPLRRVIVFFGAIAVIGTLAALAITSTGFANLLPTHAEAAPSIAADWDALKATEEALKASAIQVCSAEASAKNAVGTANEGIRQAQVDVLKQEYSEAEQSYNSRVRTLVEAGNRRPWDVASKALPLDLARTRLCMKMAVAPPRPAKPLGTIELSLTHDTYAGPTWVPAPEDRFITLEQLDAYAAQAGWPNDPGWWPDMRKIILCETRSLDTMAHNTSDPNGGSYGLAQLNGSYHFYNAGEDFALRFDPVVNLRTALWLRTVRGHYGGTGGWYNCAKLWGID